MKKVTNIVLYFIFFLALSWLGARVLVLTIPTGFCLDHTLEKSMVDFSKRLFQYRLSRVKNESYYVIVGPSYAVRRGTAKGFYNLGVDTADFANMKG